MLNKIQKKEQVALGVSELRIHRVCSSPILPAFRLMKLKIKSTLRALGAKFKVFKKRLLKIAMKDAGVEVDPTQFDAQVGTVFGAKAIYDMASPVAKFRERSP